MLVGSYVMLVCILSQETCKHHQTHSGMGYEDRHTGNVIWNWGDW